MAQTKATLFTGYEFGRAVMGVFDDDPALADMLEQAARQARTIVKLRERMQARSSQSPNGAYRSAHVEMLAKLDEWEGPR